MEFFPRCGRRFYPIGMKNAVIKMCFQRYEAVVDALNLFDTGSASDICGSF